MKTKVLHFLTTIYECFKYATKDMIIFPSSNLKPAILVSLGISAISLLCDIFGMFFFIDWKGALLGCLILTLTSFIGGKKA